MRSEDNAQIPVESSQTRGGRGMTDWKGTRWKGKGVGYSGLCPTVKQRAMKTISLVQFHRGDKGIWAPLIYSSC